MRTIASYHHKGGVGKTTTAVALAAHAAARGNRTLLWDLDPQGAATRLVGADRGTDERVGEVIRHGGQVAPLVVSTPMERLHLIPADPSLRTLDRRLDEDTAGQEHLRRALGDAGYDVVVLDCPPSVSLTAVAVLEAADLVVVPLTAGPLAWSAFADLFAEIDAMDLATRPELVAFLTMVDRRKGLHRDLVDGEEPPEGFSSVVVPTDSRVERMALETHPLRAVLTGRAGRAYGELWDEVAGQVGVTGRDAAARVSGSPSAGR